MKRSQSRTKGGKSRTNRPKDFFKRKVCKFCVEKIENADYKDVDLLQKFTTERGKILSARISGACTRHQRLVKALIKKARHLALLPYAKQ